MEDFIVTGDAQRLQAFQARMKEIPVEPRYLDSAALAQADLSQAQFLFDLTLDEQPERLSRYAAHAQLTVVGCAVKRSLSEMAFASSEEVRCKLLGINALPGFLEKPRWELSAYREADRSALEAQLQSWEIPYDFVADRVGMVTPRILCMIINEACFTVQEGTAQVPDINQAMKMGVNYPGGPFEWADTIGITHVYEVLLRLWEDTGDSRYKIAPLLKHHYLRQKPFSPAPSPQT
jgi:3-hydroxybutyryl-CoA dehydrogenase